MTIEERLREIRGTEARIGKIRLRIRTLEDELTRITARLDAVPGGGGHSDRIAAGVAQIVDLEEKLLHRIGRLEAERQEIEALIEELPGQQRDVLYARYVEGMSWNKVARTLHYDGRYVFKIHRAALRRLGAKEDSKRQ